MLDALRLIAALLLVFFIPGIMLVQALFPRKGELDIELDWLYRLALGIGLSIVTTILVNFGLNSLGVNPDTGMGYVTTVPITIILVLLTLLFFFIAWLRGGMPFMGKLHPSLIRFPSVDLKDDDIPRIADRVKRFRHQELMEERFGILKKITNTERLTEAHSGDQKKYYEDLRKKLLARLSELETEIDAIEKGVPRIMDEEKDEQISFEDEGDELDE
ncbi:MAG: DUF1616 domain-containing protein [Thermoplasmata archaeon]|nr:DUF1616 domain-containing protein [Thermoplasmata archaeon]